MEKIFSHNPDVDVVLDWLSWVLQREAKKPKWGLFFCSKGKGTGKSTICRLFSRLIGEENTKTRNSVQKLTGQFNQPMLLSKLVICEEIKLKADSPQGNTLKTFITEEVTTTESRGKDIQKVKQCCAFVLTTNHMPLWTEADDRRLFVVDCNHEGHASGPKSGEFSAFMAQFHSFLEDDRAVAKLYNALMEREQAAAFNPSSLDIAVVSNPLMEVIQSTAKAVTVEQVEEFLNQCGRFAIPQDDLIKRLTDLPNIRPSQLRHLMAELRWKKKEAKWDGADYKRVAWVHADYDLQNGYVVGPNRYSVKMTSLEPDVEMIP